jgi:hypothetical protein
MTRTFSFLLANGRSPLQEPPELAIRSAGRLPLSAFRVSIGAAGFLV